MEIDGVPAAFFGFWETVEDLPTNQKLFLELEDWAKSLGAKILVGPINFSTFYGNRIRIDQKNSHSFLGEPYNPSYYPKILEGAGFEKYHQYITAYFDPWWLLGSIFKLYF